MSRFGGHHKMVVWPQPKWRLKFSPNLEESMYKVLKNLQFSVLEKHIRPRRSGISAPFWSQFPIHKFWQLTDWANNWGAYHILTESHTFMQYIMGEITKIKNQSKIEWLPGEWQAKEAIINATSEYLRVIGDDNKLFAARCYNLLLCEAATPSLN